jgi:hypothetical protein
VKSCSIQVLSPLLYGLLANADQGFQVRGKVGSGCRVDRDLNGTIRASLSAPPTPAAGIADGRSSIDDMDRVHKTDALAALSATNTSAGDPYVHSRHGGYLGADRWRHLRQHAPEAAARTAVADGQQLVAGAYPQPDCIQSVATDQVHQAGFATTADVFQCLVFADKSPEFGIDAQYRFAEEETAQITRVVLAFFGLAAYARVHNPVMGRAVNKVLYHLMGQHHLFGWIDCLPDGKQPCLGHVGQGIALKEPVVYQPPDYRPTGHLGNDVALGKRDLEKCDEPDGSRHVLLGFSA